MPVKPGEILAPKHTNLRMEKELVRYKKEIEDKYKKNSTKSFTFLRKSGDTSSEEDSTQVSKGSTMNNKYLNHKNWDNEYQATVLPKIDMNPGHQLGIDLAVYVLV